jgi:8-oxo-dGTP pyrophosphatase MutT (NUDIX family)
VYLSRRPAHFRYYPGAFVFPGGRVDDGDSNVRSAACREVKEEIGVDIEPASLVLLRETHTSAHAGPVYHLFIYACHVIGALQTTPNPDEVEQEMWVLSLEAAGLNLPYQIGAATRTISEFPTVGGLIKALSRGSINTDYLI